MKDRKYNNAKTENRILNELVRNKGNSFKNFISLFFAFSLVSILAVSTYAIVKLPANALVFSLFAGLSILFISFLVIKEFTQETIMIATLAIIGSFYFISCPFQMLPDENEHFLRAFEISTGHLFSKQLSSGQFGDILPKALGTRTGLLDWNNRSEMSFTNTAMYSFINYFPQSLGIFLVRIFTKNVAIIYYAGRLCNFLCAFALCMFAIKKMPFAKKILFITMLFPMTLQEMISMAPDALLNSLSFAFIAFVLHCAYRKEEIKQKDIVIIGILLILIALCKIVYLGALFLIYLIPNEKIKDEKEKKLLKFGIPLIAILLNMSFLIISMRILSSSKFYVTNSDEQIKFILLNPVRYILIFTKSVIYNAKRCIENCIGSSLGCYTIGNDSWLFFLVLVCYFTLTCNDIDVNIRKTDVIIYFLYVITEIGLIFSSEYIGYTAPGEPLISGVQGRYFIPLVGFFLIPIAYKNYFEHRSFGNMNSEKIQSSYLYIFGLVFNFYALVKVLLFLQSTR